MGKHLLALALILTGATGCDNVAWGGIDVQLQAPPASGEGTDSLGGGPTSTDSVTKVPGAILLAGDRFEERAELVVVGEILEGGLTPFPDPRFPGDSARLATLTAPGSEWVLFSEGVRVGRLVADTSEAAEDYCGAPHRVSGVLELVPSAVAAERFLAFPAEDVADLPYSAFAAHVDVFDQRVAALAIARDAITRNGATLPSDGALGIREHTQAFQPVDAARPWVATTFVNRDQLGIGSPSQGAYGLLVVARPEGDGFVEAVSVFRSVEAEGKGVPQYHDHMDWDGDGASEILVDVFGATRRWFAVLDRRDGQWVRSYEDSCGPAPRPTP
ncbi:MAG: hypothetical protein HKN72_11910 [Gemmatimonadetes bacterium]|nr:hypothetical protein [Gemmatimonadota bacterium]NNF13925.1 hypothetical protein [Gemmatimonadota bacterium]